MQASVIIGQSLDYKLEGALLVYKRQGSSQSQHSDGAKLFITRHEIEQDQAGVPSLGPARLLDRGFLDTLIEQSRGRGPLEILPPNVIARTAESVCWWTPPSPRLMFYIKGRSPELEALSGKSFPQPALLWQVKQQSLRVRALPESKRPRAETMLARAPYWNVGDKGDVCLGTTRVPREISLDSLPQWEAAFFESEFSHPNGVSKLTEHPGGFAGLWTGLKGRRRFPHALLSSSGETLELFLRS